jgi:hypothetical protein
LVIVEHRDKSRGVLAIETKYTDSFSPAPQSGKQYSAIAGTDKSDAERARDALIGSGMMTDSGWSKALTMKTSSFGGRTPWQKRCGVPIVVPTSLILSFMPLATMNARTRSRNTMGAFPPRPGIYGAFGSSHSSIL